jgi:hypothetical protein
MYASLSKAHKIMKTLFDKLQWPYQSINLFKNQLNIIKKCIHDFMCLGQRILYFSFKN